MHGGAVAIERGPILAWTRQDKAFERTWFAVAVAVLLHAAMLNGVLRSTRQAEPESVRSTMLWLNVKLPPFKPVIPAPMRRPATKAAPAAKVRVPSPSPVPAPAVVVPEAAPVAEAPQAPASVQEMLSIAKRDLGKIDRELRKEAGKAILRLSGDGRQERLSKGIELAHEMAPTKWYQAAKIEDITPPGNDARKIYRIAGAAGSYCVRYPDKNRIGAQTGAANFGEPLIGACPTRF